MKKKFQYYPANIKNNRPHGFVTLPYFLRSIAYPKPEIQEVFKRIAQAEADGNMELKGKLKQDGLYYFTPCVHIDGYRRYDNIVGFTGLMVLDFDHIDNAEDFKEFLMDSYGFIGAAWLSPSKRGVKAFVNIPVVDSVGAFKRHYWAVEQEMEQYDGYDPAPQNAVLPLFTSWDKDILIRQTASVFSDTFEKPNAFDTGSETPIPDVDITDRNTRNVVAIIHSMFDKIVDNGHPQLRTACLIAGGYAATGYISDMDALQLIDFKVDTNNYLRQKKAAYKITARQAFNLGKRRPLELK